MKIDTRLRVVALGLAGILAAAGIGYSAHVIAGSHIGLAASGLSGGEELAPVDAEQTTPDASTEPDGFPGSSEGARGSGSSEGSPTPGEDRDGSGSGTSGSENGGDLADPLRVLRQRLFRLRTRQRRPNEDRTRTTAAPDPIGGGSGSSGSGSSGGSGSDGGGSGSDSGSGPDSGSSGGDDSGSEQPDD